MRNIFLVLLGLSGLMLTANGCSNPTTLGTNTGMAYGMAKQNQMLHPDAEQNLEVVVGVEGNVGTTAMEIYRKSFEAPDAGFGTSAVSTGVQTK